MFGVNRKEYAAAGKGVGVTKLSQERAVGSAEITFGYLLPNQD
jgi:hypothetical protein